MDLKQMRADNLQWMNETERARRAVPQHLHCNGEIQFRPIDLKWNDLTASSYQNITSFKTWKVPYGDSTLLGGLDTSGLRAYLVG